jgi:CSLREA domain-containing protein
MKMRISLLAVTVLSLLGFASAAQAATIQVTTTTDEFGSGTRCSLREAIWSANNDSTAQAPGCKAGSGTDTIVVPSGRFSLTRQAATPAGTPDDTGVYGDLDIASAMSILHEGVRPAVIDQDLPYTVGSNSSGGYTIAERVVQVLPPGALTLDGLTITGGVARSDTENRGGGILNGGVLSMVSSTITGNSATFGGGLSTEGASQANLTNTTVSGNSAIEDGGGISVESDGQVSLKNATVADNHADYEGNGGGDGGGVFTSTSAGGGVLSLRDSIVAANSDGGKEAPDCAILGGAILSLGRNLVGDTNGCGYATGPGDVVNQRAKLIGLRDNGGPTETHALKKGSPAIDAGKGCAATDQRGVKRSLGGHCDIGAWELVRCQGAVVNIVGTDGPDLLTGSSGVDGILALGGNDTVRAGGGRDGVCGDGGKDHLEGGAGPDRLDGGSGRDTCLGGGGVNRERRCELPRHHGKR